jgi:hypothetical protein
MASKKKGTKKLKKAKALPHTKPLVIKHGPLDF